MKKLIFILSGFTMIALAASTAYLVARLFDASGRLQITPFVFQPDNLSRDRERIGRPLALESLNDAYVRNRLIAKFVTEYFYAVPDPDNIGRRDSAYGVIKRMGSDAVFKTWRTRQLPEITAITQAGGMRRVLIDIDKIEPDPKGEYYVARFRLVTWNRSNLFSVMPEISAPRDIYMKLRFKKALRVDSEGRPINPRTYLDNGIDPSLMFGFAVDEIRIFDEHGEVK